MAKIKGSNGKDKLWGTNEADTIFGRGGNDTILGRGGNDKISGDDGDDKIFGGAGNDWIHGGKGNDKIFGGSGNDKISGGKGNDTIYGGSGHDRIDGGKGDDYIDGGDGNDRIDGGKGNDTIYGGSGHDRIDGGKGDDYIDGGDGNDRIDGGKGDDTLVGGAGADRLTGGRGEDVFVYLDASDSTTSDWDRVTDFTQGSDKIDLAALLGPSDDLAWGNTTATENGAWYENSGSSTFVFADTTGDGVADLKVELKYTRDVNLTSNDFLGVGSAPVANDGAAQGDEDTVLTGMLVATDPDGGTLNYNVVNGPASGTLMLGADGSFNYTPDANFNGSDQFTYKANDGSSDSNVATVTLTVNPVNDAPVAVADNVHTNYDGNGFDFNRDAFGNVLDNDSDPEGDSLILTEVDGSPDNLATFLQGDFGFINFAGDGSGNWSYFINQDGVNELATNGNFTDVFDYTVAEDNSVGAFASSTLSIDFIL